MSTAPSEHLVGRPTFFADPFKVCNQCGGWVTGARHIFSNGGKLLVLPCEHERGWEDVCPSWSPVDGCQCQEFLGRVPHGSPPA